MKFSDLVLRLKASDSLQSSSADFPGGILPIQGLRSAPDNPYFSDQRRKLRRRYSATVRDLFEARDLYVEALSNVARVFDDLLGDYDQQEIVDTTVALGFMKPHHHDLDEKGVLGRKRSYRIPSELRDYMINHYSPLAGAPDLEHISLPRGKNAGWPTLWSRRSRAMSDILLAIHAAYASGLRQQKVPLREGISRLESQYGTCFSQSGERYQHTGKTLPSILDAGRQTLYSTNLEPRVRGIYFSPKFAVAYNRPGVKSVLRAVLDSPYHVQDRSIIRNRIEEMFSKNFDVISLDVSKYDQSMGGDQGRDVIEIAAQCVRGMDSQLLLDGLKAEFEIPFLLPTKTGLLLSHGAEILSSGLSSTTVVGCLGSHVIVAEIMRDLGISYRDLDANRGKQFDALTYGDDIVIGVNKRLLTERGYKDVLTACIATGDRLGFSFTSEPTIKFLGQNYRMLGFKQAADYPLARFIQQQFFPERKKTYPFSTYGYVARLSLLAEPLQRIVHERMMRIWDVSTLGPAFPFEKRFDVVRSLLPLIEKKSAEISQLDDVLGIFFHGLDAEDADHANLQGGLDSFEDLLAASSLDVSDPEKVITDAIGSTSDLRRSVHDLILHPDGRNFKKAVQNYCQLYGLVHSYGPWPCG